MNGATIPPEQEQPGELPDLSPFPDEPDPLTEPAPPADPLAVIDDSVLLQIGNNAYLRSQQSRQTRRQLNRRNWRAVHGQFDFLDRKEQGQSKLVMPSMETGLEQICAVLTAQLVGFSQWFDGEFVDDPPIPELTIEDATQALNREMDRLAIEGNYLESTYGIERLVFDSLKVGLIESEICWKVSIHEEDETIYDLGADPNGPPQMTTQTKRRLKVEIVPFDDYYPDPSPAKQSDIHEVEVPIADLPAMGFTDDQIAAMRGSISSEKEEQRRIRAGTATGVIGTRDRVVLREFWGKLIDPSTGRLLDPREVTFTVVSNTMVVKRPQPITDVLWHGKRPFIRLALLPTPLSHVHHAFLDIAIPLVETESELFNLVIDGGFAETHGIKAVRSYALNNPEVLSKGLRAGITLDIAEQYAGVDINQIVGKVDSGIITQEALEVLDRSSRTRQEAFRINSIQLGQFAPRKSSATEITQVEESSDNLFSAMGERVETGGTNQLVELCWLTQWQFLDDFSGMSPDHQAILGGMTPQERFVLMANKVKFRAVGYKQLQAAVKNFQKLVTYENLIAQNPAYAQADMMENDPAKKIKFAIRALGIDPMKIRRDAESPPPPMPPQPGDPNAPPGAPGPANPAAAPNLAQATETAHPPNPMGARGIQAP